MSGRLQVLFWVGLVVFGSGLFYAFNYAIEIASFASAPRWSNDPGEVARMLDILSYSFEDISYFEVPAAQEGADTYRFLYMESFGDAQMIEVKGGKRPTFKIFNFYGGEEKQRKLVHSETIALRPEHVQSLKQAFEELGVFDDRPEEVFRGVDGGSWIFQALHNSGFVQVHGPWRPYSIFGGKISTEFEHLAVFLDKDTMMNPVELTNNKSLNTDAGDAGAG